MKKINNKGVTTVELLVSFIIVIAIVVGLFDVMMNYKNKQQIESIKNSVITYSNSLQKTIQDDMIKGHVISVSNLSTDKKSALFSFDKPEGYQKKLIIDSTNNVIQYGTTSNMINYPIPEIADLTLSSESKIEQINSFTKIIIIFHHPNFDNETYSFEIVAPLNY